MGGKSKESCLCSTKYSNIIIQNTPKVKHCTQNYAPELYSVKVYESRYIPYLATSSSERETTK